MMHPTRDDCHKDNCDSNDQQFSRILRLWNAEPLGLFSDRDSNHERLRVATEFFVGRIIKHASNLSLHEYWCDGIEFVNYKVDPLCFSFGGGCIFSDRHANAMWLAPFELTIGFSTEVADIPSAVSLRLGHADENELISRSYPTGRYGYRLYAMAHALYGERPTRDPDWAVAIDLNPYQTG